MKIKDRDIRKVLHAKIVEEFKNEYDTIVVDELGLCQGKSIIDIAVINGFIHGYEIKSESDTLERLPGQMEIYSKVLDTVTIVSGECHINRIVNYVPDWWGITVSQNNNGKVEFKVLREAKINNNIDPYSVAQLLWKDEALDILIQFGLDRGYHNKSRKIIWEKLVKSLSLEELKNLVREKLKNRTEWRADSLQMLSDD